MGVKFRVIVITMLLCAALIPAFADTSATLSLKGSVAASSSISITAASAATSLTLNSSTSTDTVTVGTITALSNSPTGYSVSVSSANGGNLKGAVSSNTDSIAYTLYVNGASCPLSTSAQIISALSSSSKTTGTTTTLSIMYTENTTLSADTYSDTITFTIAAK